MPTGTFGGFPFDPEVYQSFVDQEPTFSDSIIASGVLANDASMASAFANGGTVGTTRFYNPLDPATDAPLVRDGETDNTPSTISGGKQSFIRIDRMKAWKARQLVQELTGADPMAKVARSTSLYWRMYWQQLLVDTANAVLGVSGLASHVVTSTQGVTAGLLLDALQAALGDKANGIGMIVMHSKIAAEYKKLGLISYDKYTITNVLQREVTLPTLNGLIVIENDRGTERKVTTPGEEGAPATTATYYDCFLFGQGCFLTATPRVITPDYTEYDAATDGGTDILYNNRAMILHPNGVSFVADNIDGETPTDAEFTNSANWDLRFDAKNVRIGKIIIPATQLT